MQGPKVVMYGIGSMGSIITRMIVEKGAIVVGGICRSEDKVGRDVGEIAGIATLGVAASSDAQRVLDATRPDLVVMTIASYMEDVLGPILMCLERGIDVISLAEEPLYSWHTSPAESARLDATARAHGATLVCTGHQDGYWVSLISTMLGTVHSFTEVRGKSTWNVDSFGPELARAQQVGTTAEEFEAWNATATRPPTFGRVSLHALAAAAGLTPLKSTTTTTAVLAESPTPCAALDLTVQAGEVLGFTDIDIVETREGPVLMHEMTGKVYVAGESDSNEWTVEGEPTLSLLNSDLPTHLTTCATLVNRIPDVLNAAPGYVTIDQLPRLRYRPLPLAAYID
ncbi:NAD(P)H-dependent amine dehydrogenase family protein [Leucobacter sp. W1478]|uniref:NAD(P)H-dependent amine dehydrogenase family protein n=1 Tax=Leucobacter sp. W1478 TaxID=3439065 RepID=UPI003F2CE6DE